MNTGAQCVCVCVWGVYAHTRMLGITRLLHIVKTPQMSSRQIFIQLENMQEYVSLVQHDMDSRDLGHGQIVGEKKKGEVCYNTSFR